MKIKPTIIPALILLLTAGLLLTACPSEPEPDKRIEVEDGEDGGIVLKGGARIFLLEQLDPPVTFMVQEGKEYEVTLTIDESDEALQGLRLGGKLCYTTDLDNGEEVVLSGFQFSTPELVNASIKQYSWTFVAGDAYDDQGGVDDGSITLVPSTPVGGRQYFNLMVFGGSDGYTLITEDDIKDDYQGKPFGLKGKLEVVESDVVTAWKVEGDPIALAADPEGGAVADTGTGALLQTDMDRILALYTDEPKSRIQLTVLVPTVAGGSNNPGDGAASIGGWDEIDRLMAKIPSTASGTDYSFEYVFAIKDVLNCQPEGYRIVIQAFNGCKVTKAVLLVPDV